MKNPLLQLKSVMTPFPYSIDCGATLAEAERLLADHDFHHLPVTRDGHLAGMLTLGAIVAASGALASLRVQDVYTPHAYVVDIGTRLGEVLHEMAARKLDVTIVVRQGKLAGVFTTVDVCRAFAELIDSLDPPADDGTDAA